MTSTASSATQASKAAQARKPAQRKSADPKPGHQAQGEAALTRREPCSHEERHQMICVAAYYRAEQRGFAPGQEVTDWVTAEAEVDRLLGNTGEPA